MSRNEEGRAEELMIEREKKRMKLGIATIREASAAIRSFRPEPFEIRSGMTVTVRKLSGEDFDTALLKFEETIGVFLAGIDLEDTDWLLPKLRETREFANWLVEQATDGNVELLLREDWDWIPLLALAVLVLSFIDNATVRAFSELAPSVAASASEELAIAAPAGPPVEQVEG